MQFLKNKAKIAVKHAFFLSGCCSTIMVKGGEDAIAKYPQMFTAYTIESSLTNGHVSYTSLDESWAIAMSPQGKWKIQKENTR